MLQFSISVLAYIAACFTSRNGLPKIPWAIPVGHRSILSRRSSAAKSLLTNGVIPRSARVRLTWKRIKFHAVFTWLVYFPASTTLSRLALLHASIYVSKRLTSVYLFEWKMQVMHGKKNLTKLLVIENNKCWISFTLLQLGNSPRGKHI